MVISEPPLLSWKAPEFRHYHKNSAWYITLLIIAGLVIAYQLWQRDLFGAISIIIVTIFVALFARHKPREVDIHITAKGIRIDESHIPYGSMRNFWMVHNDNHKTLNIETTAYLNRIIVLQLENQDPTAVREILVQAVPEHPHYTEETLAQRLMHRFKF